MAAAARQRRLHRRHRSADRCGSTLKSSDPSLTFNFAQAFGAGNIASPKAVANPSSLDKSTAGAGPYMLDPAQTVSRRPLRVRARTRTTGTRTRQHWKKVTVRVITNPSSMIQAMRAGQVQAALGDATTLSAAKSAGLNVIAPPQALTGLNLLDRMAPSASQLGRCAGPAGAELRRRPQGHREGALRRRDPRAVASTRCTGQAALRHGAERALPLRRGQGQAASRRGRVPERDHAPSRSTRRWPVWTS